MFSNRKGTPFWVAGLLYLFSNTVAQSGDVLKLSLADALDRARENNYEIKLADAEVNAMQADKNKSLAVFLPQITLSETYVKTNDPLNSFGLKLKQEIVTQMDFNPALLNDPADIENFNTKFEVIQPLINLDGFFGRAAAADGLSAVKFKLKRTRNYVKFMVKMNYYQLVLMQRSFNVVSQALETTKANRELIKNYFDEGMITKADYLMSEVYVSNLESQKVDVENKFINASDNLKFMLAIKDERIVEPTDELSFTEVGIVDYQINEVLENRSDLKAYGLRVDAMSNMNTMNWMKLLPRLNAFGAYEYNDTEAFGSNANNWMIGLNLRWDIFNGYQNIAGIQKSKAELDHAQIELEKIKSQSKVEIESSVRDLETAKKRLTLADFAVEQSDESLRIIKDRYNKGLEKTTDLLNAETAASNSKLNYLKTLFFYNVSLFKIELMLEKKI